MPIPEAQPTKLPISLSVCQHPQVVEAHIAEEAVRGGLLGPVPRHLAPLRHAAPPQATTAGKWWLIVDLSAPAGHSVNDAISPKWLTCAVQQLRSGTLVQASLWPKST